MKPASPVRRLLALALTAAISAAAATAAPPAWETVAVYSATSAAPGSGKSPVEADAADKGAERVDVSVRDGYVYITATGAEVEVKVFSILGQLITRRDVPPGVVRLRLGARGIFILKAGDITRRINL